MNDRELDRLIESSLKAFGTPEPPEETEPHRFSPAFEQRMRTVLADVSPPRRHIRLRRFWYVLAAALLAMLAISATAAVATRTRRVQTYADRLGYQALGDEAALEQPALSYDLTALQRRFDEGVEIHCGEQLTRFFRNAETGEFVEFSSYPKLAFRYHISLPDVTPEPMEAEGKDALWFTDQSGTGYVLWGTPSAVIVLRSNLPRAELRVIAEEIEVYESD